MGDRDFATVDPQARLTRLHRSRKNAVGGIELREVRHGGEVGRFVDCNDFDEIVQAQFVQRTQHAATDSAIAVDGDAQRGMGGKGRRYAVHVSARVSAIPIHDNAEPCLHRHDPACRHQYWYV